MSRSFAILSAALASSVSADLDTLWPLPVHVTSGSSSAIVDKSFQFVQTSEKQSTVLSKAFDRYVSLINRSGNEGAGSLVSCSVHVANVEDDESASLVPYVDETYTLDVSESGECSITAPTVWGALHALETFTQLLTVTSSEIKAAALPVSISDAPRFTHRGMLIDTSRHFLPVDALLRIIDTLPMSNFNTLHWHMVDAQSFPLKSPTSEHIVEGAYSSTAVYSMNEVKALKEYANDRGVQIMFEIDVPGHAASWAVGYPEIMADCMDYYTNVNNYALDPTMDKTYEVMTGIIKDIIDATGAQYFHIGGDEVVYGCWSHDPNIAAFMVSMGWSSYDTLLNYFVQRADDIVRKLGATPVHWEEVFKANCDVEPDTVFEVWTSQSQMISVANANYTIISAPSDVWYLDHAENTWDVMYAYDPTSTLSAAQESLVLGGEVAMWGEHIDENNLESIVYPRAFSVGERLWSPKSVTDYNSAKKRLNNHRCRMIQRGFHPSAIEPGYCSVQFV